MPDKDKVRLLWDNVRRETDIAEAVKMIADLTEQAVYERMTETAQLQEAIAKIDCAMHAEFKRLDKVMYGNGDPSHSIIARLERIEEAQCKSTENVSRASWIVVSAVIVQIVMYLLKVL